MRWLVDAQLPPALARWLADRGDHAEHVFDIGRVDAADGVIWRRALDTSAVIVTKDEDFAVRTLLGAVGPPIVWIRYGSVRRVELLARLAEAWPGVIQALERGEVLIELA